MSIIYSFVIGSVFNILQALINKMQIIIKGCLSLNMNACLHLWFSKIIIIIALREISENIFMQDQTQIVT